MTPLKNTAAGLRLGTAASQLIGFHGVTPVVQAATTPAIPVTALVGSAAYDEAELDAVIARIALIETGVNAILVALKAKGIMASA